MQCLLTNISLHTYQSFQQGVRIKAVVLQDFRRPCINISCGLLAACLSMTFAHDIKPDGWRFFPLVHWQGSRHVLLNHSASEYFLTCPFTPELPW